MYQYHINPLDYTIKSPHKVPVPKNDFSRPNEAVLIICFFIHIDLQLQLHDLHKTMKPSYYNYKMYSCLNTAKRLLLMYMSTNGN